MKWFVLASRTGMVKICSEGFQGESRCFEVDCTHASWHRLAEDIVTSVICWKGWAFQSHLIKQLWSDVLTPCWSTTFLRMCFIPRIFTDHLSRNFVPWLDLESNFGENQHDYCAEHRHTLFVQYCLQHPPQVMTTHLLHVPVLPLNLRSYTVMSSGVKVHARFLLEGCTAGFHAGRLFVARRRERKDKPVARMPGEFLALNVLCSMCPARPGVYLEWCRKLQDEVICDGAISQQILTVSFFVLSSHQRNWFRWRP